jgi:hypothetical protein
MGSNSTVAVTPGSGALLQTYDLTGGNKVQYVRELSADTVTHGAWTLSTTASTSYIAADVQRVAISMVNNGSARVYLRYDATAPSATVNHWYLDPGDRYEILELFCRSAISFIADGSGGSLTYALGTVA